MEVLIKWTGSKRFQAPKILSYFPNEINTYHELFLGGGSIFYSLLDTDIKVNKFVLNDKDKNLINLHEYLLKKPIDDIINQYKFHHESIKKHKSEYYYELRKEFNKNKESDIFLVLNRTCANGLIRYNSKGEFNSPFHHNRDGITPENLKNILEYYQKLTYDKNIVFCNDNYEKFTNFDELDMLYLDPPYSNSINSMYMGKFDISLFEKWLENIKTKYILSYNGVSNSDHEYQFNIDFKQKELLNNSKSSFSKLFQQKTVNVQEYLYLNY